MKIPLGLLVAAAVAGAIALAAPQQNGLRSTARPTLYCGVERRQVKQLNDRPGLLPNVPGTVELLGLLPAPPHLGFQEPRLPAERHIVTVDALLDAAKAEEDNDIHLGVRDPATPTLSMITEAVDPMCARSATRYRRKQMRRVRQAIAKACGPIPSTYFRRLYGRAMIKGVVFFDRPHGQYDRAPNSIELHPILSITIDSCR